MASSGLFDNHCMHRRRGRTRFEFDLPSGRGIHAHVSSRRAVAANRATGCVIHHPKVAQFRDRSVQRAG